MNITCPIELVYGLAVVLAAVSIFFLLGKGSASIAVYNAAIPGEKERAKEKYKKQSRIIGAIFGIDELLLIGIIVMWNHIPMWYYYLFLAAVGISIVVTVFLANIDILKKRS